MSPFYKFEHPTNLKIIMDSVPTLGNSKYKWTFIIFAVLCLFAFGETHYIKKIIRPVDRVIGYTNQSQEFFIPFKKCFKVVPEL